MIRFSEDDAPSGVEILLFLFGAVFLWELWWGVRLDIPARKILVAEFDQVPFRVLLVWLWGAGAIFSEAALEGFDPRTLLTAPFVHFGILHIVFNSYVLHAVGREVEALDGRRGLLLSFFATALAASVASVAWHVLLWGGALMQAGASGGVCGLLGVLYRRAGRYLGGGMVRKQIVKWMVINIAASLFVRGDNAAHLGGFLAGAALEPALFALRARARAPLAWSLVALLAAVPAWYAAMVARAVFF